MPQRQQGESGENSCGVTPKDCPGEGLLWGSAELLRGGLEQGHYTSCWRGAWECEGGRILGAAHYCVIGSVPLQQLQLAAVRKTRMPVAEATSAPGAAYLGPCCQQGQPKGRRTKWDARVPGGRGTCPASPPPPLSPQQSAG